MIRARRSGALLLALALLGAAALCLPGSALGAGPEWRIDSLSNTTTTSPNPGFEYSMEAVNVGDAKTSGKIEFVAELPAGVVAKEAKLFSQAAAKFFPCFDATDGKSPVAGASAVVCSDEAPVGIFTTVSFQKLELVTEVEAGLSGTLLAHFSVSGGAAGDASTVDQTQVSAEAPLFGIDAFDTETLDANGDIATEAGIHPTANVTSFDLNTVMNPLPLRGFAWPVEPLRDVSAELPPGLIGNPSSVARCTLQELSNSHQYGPIPLCPPASQVGAVTVRVKSVLSGENFLGPLPVFNLVPPPGKPARFGFNILGTTIVLDASVRSGTDYGITVTAASAPEPLAIVGNRIEFWGDPASEAHDAERACPGDHPPAEGAPTAPAGCPDAYTRPEPIAFLRNPTACTEAGEGLPTRLKVDSWVNPGTFDEAVSVSHEAPGYPYPPFEWGLEEGIEECEAEPFEPSLSVKPTTQQADSPTGLDVELQMPQHGLEEPEAISESDLRGARVKLPEGMAINPSAASGQGACTTAEIGYLAGTSAPYEFSPDPANCPDSAKVGTVEIETPLLGELEDPKVPHVLKGSVYLAAQTDNPFGSLLALYIAIADEQSGVVVKLPGEVIANEQTGQLETVFEENPQVPFEDLRLHLFGGPRAALRTPTACGTYATEASFDPWSGNAPVQLESSFKISAGPAGGPCPEGGFDPRFEAGTENPIAGAYSPFSLRLTREDGSQELGGLRIGLPGGLLANLKGIPYCPDSVLDSIPAALGSGAAELAHPSCPAASQLGTVTVGAGAGPNPFYAQTGRAYWAGPYKGAPVSLAVVVPALAGPFDLGSVVVRNGFEVNPETAKITAVSDPFPRILDGVPLDVRDVRVHLDRPHYVINPTSCDPMAFDADIASVQGTHAQRAQRFQVSGCEALPFEPKLSIRLRGKTNRGAHPALAATLTMPEGSANVAAARVTLPSSEYVENAHFDTICTRVQYAAGGGGGEQCPPGSIYGYARVYSPILDYYLRGPVYLRSSSHILPDLVASLGGQIHVDVDGHIDATKKGRLRSTFEVVPDAPVSSFTLEMQGKSKGLLVNSTNLCKGTHRALAEFTAHNGKLATLEPPLKVKCSKGRARHHPYARAGR